MTVPNKYGITNYRYIYIGTVFEKIQGNNFEKNRERQF